MDTLGNYNSLIAYFSVIAICIILLIIFVLWYIEYKHQLYYIKIEISRSDEAEQKYWKQTKRTLWYRVLINIFR